LKFSNYFNSKNRGDEKKASRKEKYWTGLKSCLLSSTPITTAEKNMKIG
jgi:hypothetical protein